MKRMLLALFIPVNFNTASANEVCKKFISAPSTSVFLSKDLQKYNAPTVLQFRFKRETLDVVQSLYHQLPVPKLVLNILNSKDPDSSLLISKAPAYFRWNNTNNTFMTVNPTYTKAETVLRALHNKSVRGLKNSDRGLALITWFVHPALHRAIEPVPKNIAALELNGERYLVSILDLQAQDLPYLKNLKAMSLEYLAQNFAVDHSADKVRLDFHFPYAIENSTLHLHARVNMAAHPLELTKSYSIDEIIEYLEAGKSVKDLILDRQKRLGGFFFSADTRQVLETIDRSALLEVPNPFARSEPTP